MLLIYLRQARCLYKKFNQIYDLANKQFASGGEEAKVKSKPKPKKKGGKKGEVKKEEDKENEDSSILNDNQDETEDTKVTSNDTSSLADSAATGVQPETASNNNLSKKQGKAKTNQIKFDYCHRISYTCLLKLLKAYFT